MNNLGESTICMRPWVLLSIQSELFVELWTKLLLIFWKMMKFLLAILSNDIKPISQIPAIVNDLFLWAKNVDFGFVCLHLNRRLHLKNDLDTEQGVMLYSSTIISIIIFLRRVIKLLYGIVLRWRNTIFWLFLWTGCIPFIHVATLNLN